MDLSVNTILTALQKGDLVVKGEFLWGSNYTFLVEVHLSGQITPAVYKPVRGERPLWDFPAATLAGREVAAYLVSEALGWELVPPTILRSDGPAGPGSIQMFVQHNPEYHYFNFARKDQRRLRKPALFDCLINNADRKGSHILIDPDDHLWLIDHGLCFHVEYKLRTVIWDFAGEPFSDELCEGLRRLRKNLERPSDLICELEKYLSSDEVDALAHRADRLLSAGRFPNPSPNRRVQPWPPL
jgi:uncharacterized repeat protein (TIGR03843 family)